MDHALENEVLMESEISRDLLAVSYGCHQRIPVGGRIPVEEHDGIRVTPDHVVLCQTRIPLDEATDETAFAHLFEVGIHVERRAPWLGEYPGRLQGIGDDPAIAGGLAAQSPLLVCLKATVIQDDESETVGIGP
jgi:hypothetical protein